MGVCRRWLLCWMVLAAGPASAAGALAQAHEQGRSLYNFRCYFCHGYSGDARTLAATYLVPPPTDFTRADPSRLTPQAIVAVLEAGRPGTAMKSFKGILNREEMAGLAEFVSAEFIVRKAVNTRYHIPENGWNDHARYQTAFPFAKGEIPLSRPWEFLSPEQAEGKRLYLSTCISCHDRGANTADTVDWDARPLSYPRNNYSPTTPPLDAIASASPYAKHDVPKKIRGLSGLEKRGERLFLANCAFCHGADGTGKNWIGSFLEPHPRNLTDTAIMSRMSRTRLITAIREGIPGTSMPAWKSVLSEKDIRAISAYVNRAFHSLAKD
ncbi:MAG: cytochrome c class I [Rhodocyclales bacterium RIFCSPLOWO2_02_FULL_63_24]|nr:MAG: cytochrome c class I [Rhodocyclales bacterium RIFCSPLOWO2_02_FULL_63_24]